MKLFPRRHQSNPEPTRACKHLFCFAVFVSSNRQGCETWWHLLLMLTCICRISSFLRTSLSVVLQQSVGVTLTFLARVVTHCKAHQNLCSLSDLGNVVNWRNMNSVAQKRLWWTKPYHWVWGYVLITCRIFSILLHPFPVVLSGAAVQAAGEAALCRSEICHRTGHLLHP